MQPYFFPYIGYFQLMKAVDFFVFYDDVQYVKNSWINRNRLLQLGAPTWWTLPVERSSHTLPINQRSYGLTTETRADIEDKARRLYSTAPFHEQIQPILHSLMSFEDKNVARFNENALRTIARSLGIECRFFVSSDLDVPPKGDRQLRVIDICKKVGATRYVNAIGGLELYDEKIFKEAGITLEFLLGRLPLYKQFDDDPLPGLSILDTLMFNSTIDTHNYLLDYSLVSNAKK